MSNDQQRGAGGTPGGVLEFFAGLMMSGIGAYLFMNQVEVTTGYWRFYGMNAFGLSLLPMLVGIGILFFNGRSASGWVLTLLGFGIIIAGVMMNMHIYFQPTSLFNTLIMLGLLAAGLGLIAKSLRPHSAPPAEP
ncbi:MAG: hypothetical protein HYX75_22970 [Acidobacteria bacterium]|nr:hypothetical protein [Acidobacteriota bacterium]